MAEVRISSSVSCAGVPTQFCNCCEAAWQAAAKAEPESKKERKRKAPGAAAAAKPEFTKEAISERWQNRFKFDEIGDCTATELKEFLKGQGERVGGKKDDLVDRATRVIQAEIFRKS